MLDFATPNWLQTLLHEHKEEVTAEAAWPTILLKVSSRRMIWRYCALLGVSGKGVPSYACRLMERYLAWHVRSFFTTEPRTEEEWREHAADMSARYSLLAMSCIQLSAKMTDLAATVPATLIQSTLIKEGVRHSKEEIIVSEFQIFESLDFRLPLWTTVEVALFLATQVGVRSPLVLEAVKVVVNLTEFHRNLLETCVYDWFEASDRPVPSDKRPIVRTLPLCAGAVCAAARYVTRRPERSAELAALTHSPPSFIKLISNVIIQQIMNE